MTPTDYTKFVRAMWHANEVTERDLAIMTIGLGGEAGEVLEPIKKLLRQNKPVNLDELKLELGDVLYYLTRIGEYFGMTLQEILDANVVKLSERHPARKQASRQGACTTPESSCS